MGVAGANFSAVYDEFHDKLNRFIERVVGKNDADDVTQEVFLKIDRSLPDFKGDSSLSTWVYRIATNAALDKVRSRSYRENKDTARLEELSSGPGEVACVAQEESLSAEREAIRSEMNDCIQEFVDRLPTDYRVIIVLSEIRELKNQQVADVLGISLEAVKIRLHRARARLKEEFEAGCTFYRDADGKLACDRKEHSEEEP